jgi:hypothetical protein
MLASPRKQDGEQSRRGGLAALTEVAFFAQRNQIAVIVDFSIGKPMRVPVGHAEHMADMENYV